MSNAAVFLISDVLQREGKTLCENGSSAYSVLLYKLVQGDLKLEVQHPFRIEASMT
jgi:hypothetical protein